MVFRRADRIVLGQVALEFLQFAGAGLLQCRNVALSLFHSLFPSCKFVSQGFDLSGKFPGRPVGDKGLRNLEAGGAVRDVVDENEADVLLVALDDLDGISFRPGRIELPGRDDIVMEAVAGLLERFALHRVNVAPVQLLGVGLFCFGEAGRYGAVLLVAGVVAALEGLDLLAEILGLAVQLGRSGIHRLAGTLDVEHAQLLDFLEKAFRRAAQEQERVFGHFGDHTSSSSSSS